MFYNDYKIIKLPPFLSLFLPLSHLHLENFPFCKVKQNVIFQIK
jgi:hypothetical protein